MSPSNLLWPRTAKSSLLKKHPAFICSFQRSFSSSPERQVHQSADFSSCSKNNDRLGRRAKEKLIDREFFLSLLNSASTKREAKSYLAWLKAHNAQKTSQKSSVKPTDNTTVLSLSSGINLVSFYGDSRSVLDTPVFRQDPSPAPPVELSDRLHLALVKIIKPQLLDETTIDGIAKTLSQLSRLGMPCCVVVDPGTVDDAATFRKIAAEQADRLTTAVDAQPDSKAVYQNTIFSINREGSGSPTVLSRKALLSPLRDGHTIIAAPIAYTDDAPKAVMIHANDAVLALTKELAGLAMTPDPDEDPIFTAQRINALQQEVSLDRVILLDSLGGIPAFDGPHKSHVFINMEQEYEDLQNELLQARTSSTAAVLSPEQTAVDSHLDNLRLSQRTLAMLPSGSSGIITTPTEVANSASAPQASEWSAVGTRRLRNPLIHNLLTDKPLLSSSLPISRRGAVKGTRGTIGAPTTHTTVLKRGMPLTMLPNPRVKVWTPENRSGLKLNDPSIDLPRLVHLIEDSFNRKLDVQDYLDRVDDRLAGLIIAGEYEGGAILTWELPPGVEDDGSEASNARLVPYLDKFAVLKRSQGAGGVADIVFNAMVRSCFPHGVCWRSRKDNPVNKWYFERSVGTWKLSDTNWTMFWTTPGLPEDSQKLWDYEAVCRSIQPSWADDLGVVD